MKIFYTFLILCLNVHVSLYGAGAGAGEGAGAQALEGGRYIVVGGGLAGLTAAATLLERGAEDVQLFEAADYLGGHVKTQTDPESQTFVELGGETIYRNEKSIVNLCKKLGLTLLEKPYGIIGALKGNHFYSREAIKKQVDENPNGTHDIVTIVSETNEGVSHDKALEENRKEVLNYLTIKPEDRVGYRLKGGLASLIEALKERIGDRIHLNHRLKRMRHLGKEGYALTFQHGKEQRTIKGNNVILAIPIPALKDLEGRNHLIKPDLAQFFKEAPYAHNAKLIIPLKGLTKEVGAVVDLDTRSIYWDAGFRQEDFKGMIVYTRRDTMEKLEKKLGSKEALAAHFLERIQRFLPEVSLDVRYPIRFKKWKDCWRTYPLKWSMPVVGDEQGKITLYKDGVRYGGLFFAGEQVMSDGGSMNAAVHSGHIAAEEALKSS